MTPLHWCLAIAIFASYIIAIYAFVRALIISTKWDAENFETGRFLKYTFWAFAFSFLSLFASRELAETIKIAAG